MNTNKNLYFLGVAAFFSFSNITANLPAYDKALANFVSKEKTEARIEMPIIEQTTFLAIASPPKAKVIAKVSAVITGYSSSIDETDADPFISASGAWVHDGMIANNYLPFGTQIRIPEIDKDKIFIVKDRMSWKKGNNHFDIWFPSKQKAKEFGAKFTYIEILGG